MQTHNAAVKKLNKKSLPEIAVNQKLYVPMIAKIFDMAES